MGNSRLFCIKCGFRLKGMDHKAFTSRKRRYRCPFCKREWQVFIVRKGIVGNCLYCYKRLGKPQKEVLENA